MDAQTMTSFHVGGNALLALQTGTWLSGGALIGACYFFTLRWNVNLLALGQAPLIGIALLLGRFAFLVGTLVIIVSQFGALPLLMAAAGILVARTAAIHLGEQQ
jgi:F1F0 ATPase subunit 2